MADYKETLHKLLKCTEKEGVSDLLLSPNVAPTMRINGKLVPIGKFTLDSKTILQLIYSTLTDAQRITYDEELEIDYGYDFDHKARFRVNAFHTTLGSAVVFRKVAMDIPTLSQISAPDILTDLASLEHGLVLVVGPTGSGKTTTLAAMVDHINKYSNKHILTIEDPVEYIHKSDQSIVDHRELGTSTKSFHNALRSALREDPDVILVGEMRDIDTMRLALTAAETGHLVLSTLHTNSSYETISRIIDGFPPQDKDLVRSMLSTSLQAVISQRLVLSKDRTTRVPIHEILISTPAIRNLIREGQIPQIYSMMQVGGKAGMVTMEESASRLVQRGVIDRNVLKALSSRISDGDNNIGNMNDD
jgi:twitching motility protein PilT